VVVRHTPPMANRTDPIREAGRAGSWLLTTLGREIRVARFRSGLTQREVGRLVGRSASWVSRIEGGRVRGVSIPQLMAVAAAVGMRLYANLYPAGRRLLDTPQLALLGDLNKRLSPIWRREMEKVMPREGDLRAIDELIDNGTVRCAIEAITRFASVEAQVRSAHAKRRDIGARRLILLVRGSHANRRMIHEAGPILQAEFPISTRQALAALAAGEDPGGDCLILL
jgi:transcriptional regulator with XRE-family HTH domain